MLSIIRYTYTELRNFFRSVQRSLLRKQYLYRRQALQSEKIKTHIYAEASTAIQEYPGYHLHNQAKHKHRLDQMPYWHPLITDSTTSLAPPFLAVCNNASLVTDQCIPVLQNGQIVMEPFANTATYLEYIQRETEVMLHPLRSANKHLSCALPLVTGYSINYYHWIMECLPRALGYFVAVDQLGLDPQVIINSRDIDFQRDSLIQLGIPDDKIQPATSNITSVDTLVIPSSRHHFFRYEGRELFNLYDPVALSEVYTKIVDQPASNPTRRLLIVRNNNRRKLVNRQQVEQALTPYGFESVDLARLSFAEQLHLMQDAEIIIGTHGAGMTNTLFSNPKLVIELFPDNRFLRDTIYYYQLAAIRKLNWHTVIVESKDDQQNVSIDSETVDTILELIRDM